MNEIETLGAEAAAGLVEKAPASGRERQWLYSLLIAPSAVLANGVIQGGVISYLARQEGIGEMRTSQIVSLLSLPTMIYFLWSPITDFLVRRRTWLLLGGIAGGALITAGFVSGRLDSRSSMVLMLAGACCGQLVVAACGGMMGAIGVERAKRIAGSFYQGGSLAFGALSVFILVSMTAKVSRGTLGLIAGVLIAFPALFALAAPEQAVIEEPDFGRTMRRVWAEFKTTFLRWRAIPYTVALAAPIGTGALIGLLPGVAQDYGVSGQSVAWMNGIAGALLMSAGSLCASLIPARVRASVAYMLVGILNSASAAVLGFGPMRPGTYFLGVTLYLFTVGAAYALFTAVVLEFMGASGKTGSGRYSIINSVGNVPVLYMTLMDGWGAQKWGPKGLSAAEATMGILAASVLLTYFLTRGRHVGAAEAVRTAEAGTTP